MMPREPSWLRTALIPCYDGREPEAEQKEKSKSKTAKKKRECLVVHEGL